MDMYATDHTRRLIAPQTWHAAVAAACILLAPAVTHAQDTVDPRIPAVLQGLGDQPVVRIQARGVHRGSYRSTTTDSLTLRESDGEHRIALRDIHEIAEQSHRTGTGAVAGAFAVGVAGAFLGVVASSFCDAADCSDAYVNGAVGGAAIGAATGGVIGAGVGYLLHGWRTLYPR